jgi:hypothetical protein
MFQADELLLALLGADVRFVVIGGIAVGVHGYVRATKDLDIVPDPDPANLTRLARLLHQLNAEHVGAADFSPDEFPFDPCDADQLAQGANFRLTTALGPLDLMQWVAGLGRDPRRIRRRRGSVQAPERLLRRGSTSRNDSVLVRPSAFGELLDHLRIAAMPELLG